MASVRRSALKWRRRSKSLLLEIELSKLSGETESGVRSDRTRKLARQIREAQIREIYAIGRLRTSGWDKSKLPMKKLKRDGLTLMDLHLLGIRPHRINKAKASMKK